MSQFQCGIKIPQATQTGTIWTVHTKLELLTVKVDTALKNGVVFTGHNLFSWIVSDTYTKAYSISKQPQGRGCCTELFIARTEPTEQSSNRLCHSSNHKKGL